MVSKHRHHCYCYCYCYELEQNLYNCGFYVYTCIYVIDAHSRKELNAFIIKLQSEHDLT